MPWDDRDAQRRVRRLDELIGELETMAEPARSTALEAAAALLDVYGEGLARVVAQVGPAAAEELVEDELVAHLLLVHDLHPVDLPTRVQRALDGVRPYLASHGGAVELVGIEGADVRLRMEGSCHGCPSSSVTLKLAIEDAIRKAAPEIEEIVADDGSEPATPGALPMVMAGPAGSLPIAADGGGAPATAWATAGAQAELPDGDTALREVGGESLLFARIDGSTYAYRPDCPNCATSLERAALLGENLLCHGCGQRYDVRRAGRCLDVAGLSLDPVPLLVGDDGSVRVALVAGAA